MCRDWTCLSSDNSRVSWGWRSSRSCTSRRSFSFNCCFCSHVKFFVVYLQSIENWIFQNYDFHIQEHKLNVEIETKLTFLIKKKKSTFEIMRVLPTVKKYNSPDHEFHSRKLLQNNNSLNMFVPTIRLQSEK
jgi:hypothetical protein